ncbi:MAG: protein arginine kinase [Selenomonadaceae bacterium]|nr:protein arginine kinase [Selenomonadaceae bacterium]
MNDIFRTPTLPGFSPTGKDGDVVLVSFVRLARNFRQLPFPGRAGFQQLQAVASMAASLQGDLENAFGESFDLIDMNAITPLEREVLAEKHLVSQSFLQNPQYRLVLVSQDRRISVMVNEDDHLRIQGQAPGLDLNTPLEAVSKVDDTVESRQDMAFDEDFGYLTACPTNLGTGLRASVLLHLPGLVYTRNMNNIINISPQLGLAVRGLYGDDREVVGNIFIMSNQLTLGFSEKEIIDNLKSAVTEIIAHERRARKAIELYRKDRLADDVWRAYGILRYARYLSQKEALELISKVRLGMDMHLIDEVDEKCYDGLLIGGRTSFLQNAAGSDNMSGAEVDKLRADMVRRILMAYRAEGRTGA